MPQSSGQNDKRKTFIYKGTEVVKTGRIAEKDLGTPGGRQPRKQKDRLYEVKPHNEQDGTWTDWVRDGDLYVVINEADEAEQ